MRFCLNREVAYQWESEINRKSIPPWKSVSKKPQICTCGRRLVWFMCCPQQIWFLLSNNHSHFGSLLLQNLLISVTFMLLSQHVQYDFVSSSPDPLEFRRRWVSYLIKLEMHCSHSFLVFLDSQTVMLWELNNISLIDILLSLQKSSVRNCQLHNTSMVLASITF